MTTAIATIDLPTTFSLVRTKTTKSGKTTETRRDMLGVLLSGTVAERAAAAEWLILTDWEKGDMDATVDNICRVFTRKAVLNVVNMLNTAAKVAAIQNGKPAPADINLEVRLTKQQVLYIIQGIIGFCSADKGEKAKMVAILSQVAARDAALQAAKLERTKAFEAAQQLAAA